MGDEAPKAAAEQPQTPPSGDSTGSQEPALPELDRATMLALLDKFSDDPDFRKELRGRRTIAGLAGDVAKQQREQEREQAAREAVQKTHDEMRNLAGDDPVAFAEKWLKVDDVETIRRREAGLRDTTRREFMKTIGDAIGDLPEFKELTAEDTQAIEASLRGVPDDQVLAVFVKKATDLVGDKRATKRSEAELQKRLAEEKKAWQREQADKALQRRQSPRNAAPPARSAEDTGEPTDFTSKEWPAWYEKRMKSGGLVGAR